MFCILSIFIVFIADAEFPKAYTQNNNNNKCCIIDLLFGFFLFKLKRDTRFLSESKCHIYFRSTKYHKGCQGVNKTWKTIYRKKKPRRVWTAGGHVQITFFIFIQNSHVVFTQRVTGVFLLNRVVDHVFVDMLLVLLEDTVNSVGQDCSCCWPLTSDLWQIGCVLIYRHSSARPVWWKAPGETSHTVTMLNRLNFLRFSGTLSFILNKTSTLTQHNTSCTTLSASDEPGTSCLYRTRLKRPVKPSHVHVSFVFRSTRNNLNSPFKLWQEMFVSLTFLRSNTFAVNWSLLHVDQPETVTRETWKMKTFWYRSSRLPEVSVTEGSSCSAKTEKSHQTPLNKLQTTQRLTQSWATAQCRLVMKMKMLFIVLSPALKFTIFGVLRQPWSREQVCVWCQHEVEESIRT